MESRDLSLPDDEMLMRLRLLLKRKGKLSSSIINGVAGVPCVLILNERSSIAHPTPCKKAT